MDDIEGEREKGTKRKKRRRLAEKQWERQQRGQRRAAYRMSDFRCARSGSAHIHCLASSGWNGAPEASFSNSQTRVPFSLQGNPHGYTDHTLSHRRAKLTRRDRQNTRRSMCEQQAQKRGKTFSEARMRYAVSFRAKSVAAPTPVIITGKPLAIASSIVSLSHITTETHKQLSVSVDPSKNRKCTTDKALNEE